MSQNEEARQRRLAKLSAVAAEYGTTTKTLRRRIAAGNLTGYRLAGGRTILVDRNELDEALKPIRTA